MKTITQSDNARSLDQEGVLIELQESGICNFCQGEHFLEGHTNPIIHESKHWVATENRWPYKNSSAHVLIIYKEHIPRLDELHKGAWAELHNVVKHVVSELKITGHTLLIRSGDMQFNGGTVQHLHAQIISGDGKNPVITRIG